MSRTVFISGSPSLQSRTTAAVSRVDALISGRGVHTDGIRVQDLPPEDLMRARFDSPSIQRAVRLLEQAEGVVIATPVYKASYTGVLKAFLDLLPQKILTGKVVWPIAIGGTLTHLLMLDYALKPVLSTLGAQNQLGGVYLLDSWIQTKDSGEILLAEEAEERLQDSLEQFIHALQRGEIG